MPVSLLLTDMLARLMAVDLETLQRRSRALAELLSASEEAHFTCPRGSEMRGDRETVRA